MSKFNSHQTEMIQDSGFFVIPMTVMKSKLSPIEKLLISSILSLMPKGYCYASNAKLAEYCGCNKDVVSKKIQDWKTKDWVQTQILVENTKQVRERKIYLNVSKMLEDLYIEDIPPIDSKSGGIDLKSVGGIDLKSVGIDSESRVIDNIINNNINNKNNNIINNIITKKSEPEIISDIENFDFLNNQSLLDVSNIENSEKNDDLRQKEVKDISLPSHTNNNGLEVPNFKDLADLLPDSLNPKNKNLKEAIRQARILDDGRIELANKKKNSLNYRDIFLTEEEVQKLRIKYFEAGLSFKKGCEILQDYAVNHSKKFLNYKSHFHVMMGWVFDRVMQMTSNEVRLENLENFKKGKNGK